MVNLFHVLIFISVVINAPALSFLSTLKIKSDHNVLIHLVLPNDVVSERLQEFIFNQHTLENVFRVSGLLNNTMDFEQNYENHIRWHNLDSHVVFLIFSPSSCNSTWNFILQSGYAFSKTVDFIVSTPNQSFVDEVAAYLEADENREFHNLEIPIHPRLFLIHDRMLELEEINKSSEMSYSIFCVCYTCQNEYRLVGAPSSSSSLVSLRALYRQLNQNGHGLIAKVFNPQFRGSLIIESLGDDASNKSCDLGCDETIHGLSYCEKSILSGYPDIRCRDFNILWDILRTRLNISLETVGEFQDPETIGGLLTLHGCTLCGSIPTDGMSDTKVIIHDEKVGKFMYCVKQADHSSHDLMYFIRPIKIYVWLLIITLMVVIFCLNNFKSKSVEVVVGILTSQCVYLKGLLIHQRFFAPLAFLYFINLWYQSVVTLNLLAPPPMKVIQTHKELFESGFRIPVPDKSMFHYISGALKKAMIKFKMEYKDEYLYIDPFTKIAYTSSKPPSFLFEYALEHKAALRLFKDDAMNFKNPNGMVRNQRTSQIRDCHFVKEDWRKTEFMWMFRSLLSDEAGKTLNIVHSSGIKKFWGDIFKVYSYFGANLHKHKCSESGEDCEPVPKLSLQSSIAVSFYMHLILLTTSVLCGGVELAFFKYCRKYSKISVLESDSYS
ncbi:unnamed protein product [Orchesella dallaii]|uniref:Uncharacterized protein n=1 Tax=Orchesella dallaii TaxID=48710 RepID=A0ABP1RBK2_9HEXA